VQSAGPPSAIDPTTTPAWAGLIEHARSLRTTTTRDLLQEPRAALRIQAAGIDFDYSRQRVNGKTVQSLAQLARETGVESLREAMFTGVHINSTEGRAVLHTSLRLPQAASLHVDGHDVVADVHEVLQRMADFSEQVRSGSWTGATGEPITDVVNIGIGGSDLGPAMAYRALAGLVQPGLQCHFVSNVDPADVRRCLEGLDPARTLVIVASKTFTTAETMTNAQVVRTWLVDHLGEDSVPRHFVAVSTNTAAVTQFGIDPANMFGFWDWVGGRYSMDSAIGLSTMIAIGPVNFRALLDGFHAMDEHFRTAPIEHNAPALMGLFAVWNRDFLGIPTTAVLPYAQDLARFPAYLQQLTMESNGKSVRRDGTPVDYATGGIYWGEPGTGGQHSFYQLLHQGTDDVACDVIISARPTVAQTPQVADQHDMLVANALAQAAVLSVGRTAQEVREDGAPEALAAHKVMPGNRPVTVVMVPEISPFTLGALIAAYEHSVFVQGAVWQINSFDQWGVELGKSVATGIFDDIRAGRADDPSLDPATQDSVANYLAYRRR
jgi:glucose-6-phosphate isomerase